MLRRHRSCCALGDIKIFVKCTYINLYISSILFVKAELSMAPCGFIMRVTNKRHCKYNTGHLDSIVCPFESKRTILACNVNGFSIFMCTKIMQKASRISFHWRHHHCPINHDTMDKKDMGPLIYLKTKSTICICHIQVSKLDNK